MDPHDVGPRPGLRAGGAIAVQLLLERGVRKQRRDGDTPALLGRERVRAVGRAAEEDAVRTRLTRHDTGGGDVEVRPVVLDLVSLESLDEQVDRLLVPRSGVLVERRARGGRDPAVTAADAPLVPAPGEDVGHVDRAREHEGVVVRQRVQHRPEADVARPLGGRREECGRVGRDREPREEEVLDHRVRVVAEPVGVDDLLEHLGVEGRRRLSRMELELGVEAEPHGRAAASGDMSVHAIAILPLVPRKGVPMIVLDLTGRVAVVTGASSGVGRAIARRLGAQGAAVVCADVRGDPAPGGYDADPELTTVEAIERDGGRALFVEARIDRLAAGRAVVAAAVEAYGRLDVLVNNAGVAGWDRLEGESEETFDRIFAVNVRGLWGCCKAAVERFLAQGDGGRIVNIASVGGLVGLPGQPAYSASKGAVVNLSRQIAVDYAAHRIACNAVCPGALETSLMRGPLGDPDIRAAITAATPWPRLGRPEDVAAFVGFLATDHAEWITGAALSVDGGYAAL